jgi:hypothetical protein
VALHRRGIRPGRYRDWRGAHRVEQLRAGQEDYTGACKGERPAAPTRINLEIVAAALDRAESDRIDHQPRLEARLDLEEATDLLQHRNP